MPIDMTTKEVPLEELTDEQLAELADKARTEQDEDEDEDEGEDGRITPPDCVFDDGMNPEDLGVEIAGMKM
jgi:hypothetical protein